jgi:hypothetical protein
VEYAACDKAHNARQALRAVGRFFEETN